VNIKVQIRTISDFPKPGIVFRDITTVLKDRSSFKATIDQLAKPYVELGVRKVAGVESRGFILAGALAFVLGAGFVPIRKKGKLPAETFSLDYELEYGVDRLEMHADAIETGEKVLLVDDLIATGGTAEASCRLIERAGGVLVGCAFVVDLPHLGGRQRLMQRGWNVFSLCEFQSE